MDSKTIFSKTAKGLREASGTSSDLPRALRVILKEVDGKKMFSDIKAVLHKYSEEELRESLERLENDGYVRDTGRLVQKAEPSPVQDAGGGFGDLDFTALTAQPAPPAKTPHNDDQRKAQEAKAKLESEQKALQLAKAKQEAEEKARQEALLAKAKREAEENARRAAEEKTQREAAEKAKREAEEQARKAAEEKARIEAEARARRDADERAQREHEAAVKAKREVEEQARRLAEEQEKRETEVRARKEAEELARREREEAELAKRTAEELARRVAEEQARREAEARARKEAEELAQREREAAEQAKREAEDLARRAAEAKALREAEERARKEAEEQVRIEAEARAKREAEERAQAEAAEREKREAEEQTRREAEEKARLAAWEHTKRKAEEKLRLEAEAKARQEAEDRIRIEAKERAAREEEARLKEALKEAARREAEEKAKQEREARIRKEAEEELRLEALEKAKQEAKERAEREAAEKAARDAELAAKLARVRWGKLLALVTIPLVAISLGLVHFISFAGRIPSIEKTASEQFAQPVKIGSLHFSLFPRPHWRLDDVSVGSQGEIRVPHVDAIIDLPGFGAYKTLVLESPVLKDEAAGWLLFGQPQGQSIQFASVRANDVAIESASIDLARFNAKADIGPDGNWQKIVLERSVDNVYVELHPGADQLTFEMTATSFTPPFGGSMSLEDFSAKGRLGRKEMTVAEFDGRNYGGSFSGNANLRWGEVWSIDGSVNMKQLDNKKLAPALLGGGRGDAKAAFAMQAKDARGLLVSPHLEGRFTLGQGEVIGVDMMHLLQNSADSGKTGFREMNGTFVLDGGITQIRQMRMDAGILSASGSAEIDAQGAVHGRFATTYRFDNQQRNGTLSLSGTLQAPRFTR